jgi:hypothetical protein
MLISVLGAEVCDRVCAMSDLMYEFDVACKYAMHRGFLELEGR